MNIQVVNPLCFCISGQNKPKDRPRPPKFLNENKLCPNLLDGKGSCMWASNCKFMHDIDKYLGETSTNMTTVTSNC